MNGQFRRGFDPRRHVFTAEDCRKGQAMQVYQKTISQAMKALLSIDDRGRKIAENAVTKAETDVHWFKEVLNRTEGSVAQKVVVSDAEVFAAFARGMTAEGISAEVAEAVMTRVLGQFGSVSPEEDEEPSSLASSASGEEGA